MIRRQSLHILCGIFSLVTAFATSNFGNRFSSVLRENGGGGGDFSELTSALSRLDQQWQIQQSSKKTKSRWSKLMLPAETNDTQGTHNNNDVDQTTTTTANNDDYVWLLEPSNGSIPSCVLLFTGGAGLGQFPHIAYNEVLSRVSDRLNACVLAAPYSVGLDHFKLAKETGERLRRGLMACQDDAAKQYPSNLPTYCLTHSLGGKLATIYVAATSQHFDGLGFMAFNNFSFSQTISMARMFASQIRKNTRKDQFPSNNPLDNEELLNNVFSFAEGLLNTVGVDFSPNAKDTERLLQMRYDDVLQQKTRLFVFDEDNLDNAKEFMENCSGGPGPSASGLTGGHLAPIYFKLGLDDLDLGDDVPPEAQEMAKEAMGGFESASFGDEQALNELVDEICDWILGKGPKRGPQWEAPARNEPPRLAGFSASD